MESLQVLWSTSGHIVSEHATTEGLAVWKVGACQAVVAVVTVLIGGQYWCKNELRALLTIGRCTRRAGGHHFPLRLEEVCMRSEEAAR